MKRPSIHEQTKPLSQNEIDDGRRKRINGITRCVSVGTVRKVVKSYEKTRTKDEKRMKRTPDGKEGVDLMSFWDSKQDADNDAA